MMQLIRDTSHVLNQSIVTIGNFDGLHLGHQTLIKKLVATAHQMNLPSVFLTFEPHPTEYFAPKNSAARLMRFSEKWREIKKYGVDYFYCLRFNKKLAELSATDFVKQILVNQLHIKKIIIGDNFRFGAKRLGDVALLTLLSKQYRFDVEAIAQSLFNGERISSTRVRHAIAQGHFHSVLALTGKAFTLSGKVSYGNQMGRTLGFPTANIYLKRKQVPMMGIFIVCIHGLNNKIMQGVASIGCRPTFNGKQIILEVFIFDFDELIYGRCITIEFLKKIRDEIKYESIDELVTQMRHDVDTAKKYFIAV